MVAILAAGIFMAFSDNAKMDTKLTIKAEKPIHEGDSIKVKLTDLNDTPIANQTINITITDKDNTSSYYSVVTNEKGVGKLKLEKGVGKYKIDCTYGGNENYTGNSTVKKIKIEEEVVESTSSSSSYDDGYTYSAQGDKYYRDSGEWNQESNGDRSYTYKGSDGALYTRYYDANGNPISTEDHYR